MIKKKLSFIIIHLLFFVSFFSEAQPPNDLQCKPQILGSLPAAPLCGGTGGNLGPTVFVTSATTIGATNDSLSGPITACYNTITLPIKDVWYQFTASETHVQIIITGFGPTPLRNPYVGIYESANNECVGLMPRDCFSRTLGTGTGPDTMIFGPLTYGIKYYLQVASTNISGNGTFRLEIQSKNNCADCLQNSILQSYPLPVQAAYPPGDSVGFCYSVIGYKQQFGNRLHGVVPVFGNGWDVNTFKVIKTADSADAQGRWKYLTGVNIKGIKYDGFFYDVGNDNDPTNNLGDQGTPATIWTFCFTIKAKASCPGSEDLSIRFNTFSDGESGSLITTKDCSGDKEYTFKAHMSCCPKPLVVYPETALCKNSSTGKINAYGGTSFLGYTYQLYNNTGKRIDKTKTTSITQTYSYDSLAEGNYYLYITDNTPLSCQTGVNVYVPGPVTYYAQQTSFVCGTGSCTNSAKIIITTGNVSSYKWSNGSTVPNPSNLCLGMNTFTLTVAPPSTCKIIDSIFIVNIPSGKADFRYGKKNYCTSDPFATVINFPSITGGVFSTNATGVTIDPNTGTLSLAGLTTNEQIFVKYSSGAPCFISALDTIFVEVSPPPVSIYSDHNLCLGDPNLVFTNPATNNYIIKWYLDSTLDTLKYIQSLGNSLTPASSGAGTYTYYLTQVISASSICESAPITLKIDVYPKPVIDAGKSQTICPGFGAKLIATGATNYIWQPGNLLNTATISNPIASPTATTLFTVTGTDATSGCSSTDTVTIFVSANGKCDIVIYNGFTPNGDNHNDYWHIDGIGSDEKNEVTIFNRWGDKLWETKHYDNQTNKWEGQQSSSNKTVPDGTYFYVIQYKGETFKGWVELTR